VDDDEEADGDDDNGLDAVDMQLAAVSVLQRGSWPSAGTLHLDESQLSAVQTALTKRIAIVQGPPGTGKTYIGLKVVQVARCVYFQRTGCPKKCTPLRIFQSDYYAVDRYTYTHKNAVNYKSCIKR